MIAKDFCERISSTDILDMLPGIVMVLNSTGEPVYINEVAKSTLFNDEKNIEANQDRKSFLKKLLKDGNIIRGEVHSPFGSNSFRFTSNPFTVDTADGKHDVAVLMLASDMEAEELSKNQSNALIDDAFSKLRISISDLLLSVKSGLNHTETCFELERIVHTADDMRRLIKIDLGQLKKDFNKSELNIVEIVKRVVEKMTPFADVKNIKVEMKCLETSIIVPLDKHLEIVFEVLLRNAIAYSPNGKEIVVSIENMEDEALISVRDFGPGISENKQSLIYNKHFFETEPGEKMKSTGSGLYIAKHIVELHGGVMWLESSPEKGTLFSVSLPSMSEAQE